MSESDTTPKITKCVVFSLPGQPKTILKILASEQPDHVIQIVEKPHGVTVELLHRKHLPLAYQDVAVREGLLESGLLDLEVSQNSCGV